MYAKNGYAEIAIGILWRMEEKEVFSWTSMIVCYSNSGQALEVLSLFAQISEEDVKPNKYTLTSVLKASTCLEGLKEGCQIHGYAIKTGFEGDISARISLVDLYAKIGDISSALLVFDKSTVRDLILYTAMIGGYSQAGMAELTFEIFLQMLEEFKILPNEFTFANIIATCANVGDCQCRICFHGLAYKMGHASVVHVEGALTDMYAESGRMKDACKIIEEKDSISCSSILLVSLIMDMIMRHLTSTLPFTDHV